MRVEAGLWLGLGWWWLCVDGLVGWAEGKGVEVGWVQEGLVLCGWWWCV